MFKIILRRSFRDNRIWLINFWISLSLVCCLFFGAFFMALNVSSVACVWNRFDIIIDFTNFTAIKSINDLI